MTALERAELEYRTLAEQSRVLVESEYDSSPEMVKQSDWRLKRLRALETVIQKERRKATLRVSAHGMGGGK